MAARRTAAALLAAALAAAPPAHATAMDLQGAATRLAGLDADLAACLAPPPPQHPILPVPIRDCIAAARAWDHSLRRDLNGWIPLLADTDPDRATALRLRQTLNTLRTFMNQVDVALLHRRMPLDPADFRATVRAACDKAGLGQAGGPARPRFQISSLCD